LKPWNNRVLEKADCGLSSPDGIIFGVMPFISFDEGILCDSKSSLLAHRFRIVLLLCRLRRTRPEKEP
jgi:hypothetical protein